jgi:hypothetical protein
MIGREVIGEDEVHVRVNGDGSIFYKNSALIDPSWKKTQGD